MKEVRPLESLKRTALQRKPGYLEACLTLGSLDERTQTVHFTPEAWLKIRQEYGLPSLPKMAGSLAGAAVRAVGAAAAGKKVLRSNEDIEKISHICEACEFYVKESKRCSKCGCFAALKIRMMTEHCPLDPPKW